jgi:hypothetical protein
LETLIAPRLERLLANRIVKYSGQPPPAALSGACLS